MRIRGYWAVALVLGSVSCAGSLADECSLCDNSGAVGATGSVASASGGNLPGNTTGGTTFTLGGTSSASDQGITAVGGDSAATRERLSIEVLKVQSLDTNDGASCGAHWGPISGDSLLVTLKFSQTVYWKTCYFGMDLFGFTKQLPTCGSSQGYYLGDTYYENKGPRSLVCDVIVCRRLAEKDVPFDSQFSRLEFVETGKKLPPNASDSSMPVPVVEVQKAKGPYQLSVDYTTDPLCSGSRPDDRIVVTLPDVP